MARLLILIYLLMEAMEALRLSILSLLEELLFLMAKELLVLILQQIFQFLMVADVLDLQILQPRVQVLLMLFYTIQLLYQTVVLPPLQEIRLLPLT